MATGRLIVIGFELAVPQGRHSLPDRVRLLGFYPLVPTIDIGGTPVVLTPSFGLSVDFVANSLVDGPEKTALDDGTAFFRFLPPVERKPGQTNAQLVLEAKDIYFSVGEAYEVDIRDRYAKFIGKDFDLTYPRA